MTRPPQHPETATLLARLDGVRSMSDGWVALCPVHSDHRPSLGVAEGRKGVLLICRVGCKTAVVVGEIGLSFRDLFYR
jgi:hypothetical protein